MYKSKMLADTKLIRAFETNVREVLPTSEMERQEDRTKLPRAIKQFAKNFVSFIFNNLCELDYQSEETGRSHKETSTKPAFNKTMRKAIKYIYSYETRNFCLENIHTWDKETYVCAVQQMRETLLRKYEAPEMVLDFCVDVAALAKMFKDNVRNAYNLAVIEIGDVLMLFFTPFLKGRLDSFNTAAKDICERISCDDTMIPLSSDPTELRNMASNDKPPSDGSGDESEMHVDDPEHTSVINENRSDENLLFLNVSGEKRNLEPADAFGSLHLRKKSRFDFN